MYISTACVYFNSVLYRLSRASILVWTLCIPKGTVTSLRHNRPTFPKQEFFRVAYWYQFLYQDNWIYLAWITFVFIVEILCPDPKLHTIIKGRSQNGWVQALDRRHRAVGRLLKFYLINFQLRANQMTCNLSSTKSFCREKRRNWLKYFLWWINPRSLRE